MVHRPLQTFISLSGDNTGSVVSHIFIEYIYRSESSSRNVKELYCDTEAEILHCDGIGSVRTHLFKKKLRALPFK